MWIVLGAYNLGVFGLYAFDKWAAKQHRRRVPERRLLWAAALFGGLGALLAMRLVHHKTRKPPFTWSVPLFLTAQGALLVWARRQGWF
jgi:uncharacterized membrane protein YsdA (DUF1294 family)